jgi:DNA-directed RNA polymerase specialized sigma24 family protein
MLGSRERLLRSGANRLDSSGEEVMMEPSDAEVIAASIGDPPAFGALFDRHAAVLFRFLVRRVGPDVADTLLGEAFRIAFERRATFDVGRTTARPWMYGIATNVLAKHRRTEARRLRATAHLAARPVLQDDAAEQVAAAVDADELWPRVANAIAELPDPERNVLLLFAWRPQWSPNSMTSRGEIAATKPPTAKVHQWTFAQHTHDADPTECCN